MTTPAQSARAQARQEAIRIIPTGQTVAGTGPKVRTPVGEAPVIPLLLIFIGGYLAWFGVHYFKRTRVDGSMLWPSDPIKAILTGQGSVQTAAEKLSASDTATLTAAFSSGGSGAAGSAPGTSLDAAGTYSHTQIEQLWTSNGGNPAKANLAAAIAEAESSGETAVTSQNPDGGVNVGLWQLDTRGKGAGYTEAQLQDPATNARVAIMGSANGTDWSAWATYASGAYLAHMGG